MRPWPLCWLGWCLGHVESDETEIWWQCARCGKQMHRAKRLPHEVLIRSRFDAKEQTGDKRAP